MEDDILIDSYFKGLLSKNEKQIFLERLKSDKEFNERFLLEKQLLNTLGVDSWSFVEETSKLALEYKKILEEKGLKDLKTSLAGINSEVNTNKRSIQRRFYYYLAAASIIVLLGIQFFFNQNISNRELYNKYVGLNELPSFVTRNDDSNQLAKAQDLFENKKFTEALEVFQSLKIQLNNRESLFIYKGISQTEIGRYENAEKTFNSLINSDLLGSEKGYWYKALLYLKQDRVEEVKRLLNYIDYNLLYKNVEAKELLQKLNE